MNDRYYGKKLVEESELETFLREYQAITGVRLGIEEHVERPDFIVRCQNGKRLGIELTKVMREPKAAFFQQVVMGRDYADPGDAAIDLEEAIYLKEKKRRRPD